MSCRAVVTDHRPMPRQAGGNSPSTAALCGTRSGIAESLGIDAAPQGDEYAARQHRLQLMAGQTRRARLGGREHAVLLVPDLRQLRGHPTSLPRR